MEIALPTPEPPLWPLLPGSPPLAMDPPSEALLPCGKPSPSSTVFAEHMLMCHWSYACEGQGPCTDKGKWQNARRSKIFGGLTRGSFWENSENTIRKCIENRRCWFLPSEADTRMPVVSDSYCFVTNSPRMVAVISDKRSFLMHLLIMAGLCWEAPGCMWVWVCPIHLSSSWPEWGDRRMPCSWQHLRAGEWPTRIQVSSLSLQTPHEQCSSHVWAQCHRTGETLCQCGGELQTPWWWGEKTDWANVSSVIPGNQYIIIPSERSWEGGAWGPSRAPSGWPWVLDGETMHFRAVQLVAAMAAGLDQGLRR